MIYDDEQSLPDFLKDIDETLISDLMEKIDADPDNEKHRQDLKHTIAQAKTVFINATERNKTPISEKNENFDRIARAAKALRIEIGKLGFSDKIEMEHKFETDFGWGVGWGTFANQLSELEDCAVASRQEVRKGKPVDEAKLAVVRLLARYAYKFGEYAVSGKDESHFQDFARTAYAYIAGENTGLSKVIGQLKDDGTLAKLAARYPRRKGT